MSKSITTGSKVSREEQEVVEKFTTKWPSELEIEPLWKIPVAKNYTALVYEDTEQRENHKTGALEPATKCYRLVVRHNKSGKAPKSLYTRTDKFSKLLNLRITIEDIIIQLEPKKKVVETSDEDY